MTQQNANRTWQPGIKGSEFHYVSRKVYNPTARDGICTADGGQLGAVHHGEDVQLLPALDLPHA